MSGLQLSLYTFGGDLAGTPVVVDILDQDLHLVAQEAVVVGGQHYFEVDAGRYGIEAFLPSGRSVTDIVAVNEGPPVAHVMDLSEISPHESVQRTAVLKPTSFETPGDLNEFGYSSIWLRLWARIDGIWSVQEWPRPPASWDSDAVRYWFRTVRQQHMLQVGGPQIPWRMVALPAAESIEVCVRPSGNGAEPQLAITVATDNNVAEALLGYLTIGALGHAGLVNKSAEDLLFAKVGDPAAAAVGGYYLLRTSDLARLHQWPQNLANWMQWMPDGALIHAWQLIRQQQEAEEPEEAALRTGRDRLLEAVERGVPVYTEGLRLLVAGLKLLDFEADGRDREVRDALDRVRPFAAAADLGQPTTTFTGSSPMSASTWPIYGLPKSHRGLAFLHTLRLQDLIDVGLIEAETPLFMLPFASLPAEARITARGTIRLQDGREYKDPWKAAAEATFYDPWYTWSVPGGPTLAELRQRAREGLTGNQILSS
jgi:Restriction Enzyme Adenine Methylase Associated